MSEDIKKLDDLDNVRVLLARHKQACEAVVPENEPAGEDAAVEHDLAVHVGVGCHDGHPHRERLDGPPREG